MSIGRLFLRKAEVNQKAKMANSTKWPPREREARDLGPLQSGVIASRKVLKVRGCDLRQGTVMQRDGNPLWKPQHRKVEKEEDIK